MTVTIDREVFRKVRLAAALHDMTENEWCRTILSMAAKRAVEKYMEGEE